jgi:hypothetical protein
VLANVCAAGDDARLAVYGQPGLVAAIAAACTPECTAALLNLSTCRSLKGPLLRDSAVLSALMDAAEGGDCEAAGHALKCFCNLAGEAENRGLIRSDERVMELLLSSVGVEAGRRAACLACWVGPVAAGVEEPDLILFCSRSFHHHGCVPP